MKKIFLLLILYSVLSSCSSIFYTNRVKNNTFSIVTNIDNYRVSFPKAQGRSYVSNGKHFSHTLPKLRQRYLTVEISKENYETQKVKLKKTVRLAPLIIDVASFPLTLGTPLLIDVFKSDFYKLKNVSQNININLVHTQSYMLTQFNNIKATKNPEVLSKFILDYPYFSGINQVVELRDSLEFVDAISSNDEKKIKMFIQTRTTSKFIPEATKIEAALIESRVQFEKAKLENTIVGLENFIRTYPKSIQIEEARRLLVERAEKNAYDKKQSADLIKFWNSYLIPNQEYLKNNDYWNKKLQLESRIATYIESELKDKDYSYHVSHYAKYLALDKNNLEEDDLIVISNTYRKQLSGILFKELVEKKSLAEQKLFTQKVSEGFPSLYSGQDIFLNVLENYDNKNGKVTLFNTNYCSLEFKNNRSKYKNTPTYLFTYNYQKINFEQAQVSQILNFHQNYLRGTQEIVTKDGFTFRMNVSDFRITEEEIYLNNSKIGSNHYDFNGKFLYKYEFENGVNLTLRSLDNEIKLYDNLIKNNDPYSALAGFQKLAQNKFPSEISQNILIASKIEECQLLISRKEEEEQRRLENERIALEEAEKARKMREIEDSSPTIQALKLLSPADRAYFAQVIKMDSDPRGKRGNVCGNGVTKCEWCGKSVRYQKTLESRILVLQLMTSPMMALNDALLGMASVFSNKKTNIPLQMKKEIVTELNQIRAGSYYFCSSSPPKFCSPRCKKEHDYSR